MALILSGDTGPSIVSASALPAGSVVQTVNATYETLVSSTNTTYVDTGLTATITPSSSTSKILVLISQNGISKVADTNSSLSLLLLRNGSSIKGISLSWGYGTNLRFDDCSLTTCYLDSPATTSAVTYKTQFRDNDAGGTVYAQYNGSSSASTITLMEIKQ